VLLLSSGDTIAAGTKITLLFSKKDIGDALNSHIHDSTR